MAQKSASKKPVPKSGAKKKSAPPAKKAVKSPAKKAVPKPAAKAKASAPSKGTPVSKLAPKTLEKPTKTVKPVGKKSVPEKVKKAEAAVPLKASTKVKAAPTEDTDEVQTSAVPKQTVVSMLESDPHAEDDSKVEKVSKIKPIKIEKGNLADEKAKWIELNKKYGKEKALPYKMSEKFPTMIPLQHKVLGWGFILTNENDRLEVLFETGIRMLISNYKS